MRDLLEKTLNRFEELERQLVDPVILGDSPKLTAAIRERRPDVKVLFVSGYTEQLELDAGDPHAAHVTKPVTRSVLLREVAGLLGGRPS